VGAAVGGRRPVQQVRVWCCERVRCCWARCACRARARGARGAPSRRGARPPGTEGEAVQVSHVPASKLVHSTWCEHKAAALNSSSSLTRSRESAKSGTASRTCLLERRAASHACRRTARRQGCSSRTPRSEPRRERGSKNARWHYNHKDGGATTRGRPGRWEGVGKRSGIREGRRGREGQATDKQSGERRERRGEKERKGRRERARSEALLGRAAHEPPHLLAVALRVLAHLLLRTASQSSTSALRTRRGCARPTRARARGGRTAASTLAGELMSGVSCDRSEMTEMSCVRDGAPLRQWCALTSAWPGPRRAASTERPRLASSPSRSERGRQEGTHDRLDRVHGQPPLARVLVPVLVDARLVQDRDAQLAVLVNCARHSPCRQLSLFGTRTRRRAERGATHCSGATSR